jgi:hypothetical protein
VSERSFVLLCSGWYIGVLLCAVPPDSYREPRVGGLMRRQPFPMGLDTVAGPVGQDSGRNVRRLLSWKSG